MNIKVVVLVLATLLLAACGSAPQRKVEPGSSVAPAGGGYLSGDGPGTGAPGNLDTIPDAVPRMEPLHRYANRPYSALGTTYTPQVKVGDYKERGMASWYGKKFHGQRTSSGETYDMYAMSAAHPTLPLPSYARVTNLANQKSVVVRVNDRGPFLHDRVIDLSYVAAYKLGIVESGSAEVEVESIIASDNVMPASLPKTRPIESNAVVLPAATISTVALTSLESGDAGVYLQLGAFESQQNAEIFLEKMRAELSGIARQFKLSTTKDGLVRVHVGPYSSQSEARSNAESMEERLGFKPMLNLP